MKYQKKSVIVFFKVFLILSLLIIPFITHAENYYVSGRIYSARPLYEDEDEPNNPLTGIAEELIIGPENMVATTERNLVTVTIMRTSDNKTLSTSVTRYSGLYFNSLSLTDSGTLSVKIVVKEFVNNAQLFQSEPIDIEPFPSENNIRYILVPEAPHEIGNGRDFPSVSLGPDEVTGIFTRVGKIELEHDGERLIDPDSGLATVEDPVADYLGIPEYFDSPFGGKLFLFGAFSADLYNDLDFDPDFRYRIKIENCATYEVTYISEPLRKTKYTVNTSTMTVDSETVTLGPDADNYYKLTGLSEGNNVFYSYPDLLAIWPTYGLNGKYKISIEEASVPEEMKFVSPPGYSTLVINLDNVAPTAAILPIDPDDPHAPDTPRVYIPGDVPPDDLTDSFVGDFSSHYSGTEDPTCMILNMDDTDQDKYLAFKLSAYHNNGYEGYIRYWKFQYYRNDDKNEILIGKEYDPGTPATLTDYNPPIRISSVEDSTSGFENKYLYLEKSYLLPEDMEGCSCAYRFRISVATRTTDGYHYLRWREDNDYHYVQLCP